MLTQHYPPERAMKAKAVLVENFWIVVDNGRTHSVALDLPTKLGGTDKGPTALELTVMGLAGCVATIFAIMAKKMRIPLRGLEVSVEAEKPEGAKTIASARVNAKIVTDAEEKVVERAWKLTLENCPVGVLFEKAGVKVEASYTIEKP